MEIVGIDADDRADGNGKAGLTWISKNLLKTNRRINPADSSGAIGTGANGGWENCEMRTYLKNTIKPLIPETVRNAIVPVTKIQSADVNGSVMKNGQTTTDELWIPSCYEVNISDSTEDEGAQYSGKFDLLDNNTRIKKKMGVAKPWWLRSVNVTNVKYVHSISAKGGYNYGLPNTDINGYIALGFCT